MKTIRQLHVFGAVGEATVAEPDDHVHIMRRYVLTANITIIIVFAIEWTDIRGFHWCPLVVPSWRIQHFVCQTVYIFIYCLLSARYGIKGIEQQMISQIYLHYCKTLSEYEARESGNRKENDLGKQLEFRGFCGDTEVVKNICRSANQPHGVFALLQMFLWGII